MLCESGLGESGESCIIIWIMVTMDGFTEKELTMISL